jgi:hypothetical protein
VIGRSRQNKYSTDNSARISLGKMGDPSVYDRNTLSGCGVEGYVPRWGANGKNQEEENTRQNQG